MAAAKARTTVRAKAAAKGRETDGGARARLLDAGAALFARKGFAGTTVRDICDQAGTGNNMVHHYFGSKQGLFDELIAHFSDEIFRVPVRVIQKLPDTREAFVSRFELFIEESLEAMMEHQLLYIMAMREEIIPEKDAFADYNASFIRFLKHGKKQGFLGAHVDPAMLTGFVMDRLGAQVMYSNWIQKTAGVDIYDPKFRARWLRANIDLFLSGMLA